MSKVTSATDLIAKINAEIPGANAVPASDFYDRESTGIWFRGSETCFIDGIALFNYYDPIEEVHPKLQELLSQAGWDYSPHDPGTLMAYPA